MKHQEINIERTFKSFLKGRGIDNVEIKDFFYIDNKDCRYDQVFEALQFAYNLKYGNWDSVNDIRQLDKNWYLPILSYVSNINSVLCVGANDGREIQQIFKDINIEIDLVDISNIAIDRAKKRLEDYQNVNYNVTSFEIFNLKKKYDMFLSLRTFNSSGINIELSLAKSIESVKEGGLLIYSISNGYIHKIDGVLQPVSGMFDYETNTINKNRPQTILKYIIDYLESRKISILNHSSSISEIFIVCKK